MNIQPWDGLCTKTCHAMEFNIGIKVLCKQSINFAVLHFTQWNTCHISIFAWQLPQNSNHCIDVPYADCDLTPFCLLSLLWIVTGSIITRMTDSTSTKDFYNFYNLFTFKRRCLYTRHNSLCYLIEQITFNPFQSNFSANCILPFSANCILPSSYLFWAGKRLVDYL
jgi:hypothetical protein